MKRIAVAVSIAAACLVQQASGISEESLDRMDEIVQRTVSEGTFTGAALVAIDGKIEFEKGYGYADKNEKTPITPTTRFRVGSVTKQFTAAAILLLGERGKLSVDDLLGKHLPDVPAAWDKITLFHLLTHTSGIPNHTDFPEFASTLATPMTPEQLIAGFRDKPLDFRPGKKWAYSNSGYVLLGSVIERVSGQTYASFLAGNIFKPFGMDDSGYEAEVTLDSRHAKGYSPGPDEPADADIIHMSIPFSAGGLFSTTRDLLRWQQGLYGGELLSEASIKKLTTPYKGDYAFGIFIRQRYWTFFNRWIKRVPTPLYEHGGEIPGFSSELAYYPKQRLTVAVLGNLNGGTPFSIAWELGRVAYYEIEHQNAAAANH